MTGGHPVQDATQAEQVGPAIDGLPESLFRGHVGRGAQDDARPLSRRRVPCQRLHEPEIKDLDPLTTGCRTALLGGFDPEVAWLDVSMDEPAGMGDGETGGDFATVAK